MQKDQAVEEQVEFRTIGHVTCLCSVDGPSSCKTGYVSCYPRYLFVLVLLTVRVVEKRVTFRVTHVTCLC